MQSRIVSGLVGGLLVLSLGATPALAAPGAEAGAETVQDLSFHKSRTVVTVDAGATAAFDFFGITLDALRPASGGASTYTFPACVRRNGVTELAGGLKFTANAKSVKVNSVVINTRTDVVKAVVAGRRVDLFTLDGQHLVLTTAGADALNKGLGFDALFAEGFVFGGYATTK
ncbi:hypothetical protein [Kibdelosporangium phytohabitans]|uniref:Htaa domain-containing protein n=1 Tax=Kibdelosporangium phytohabitans TaxID=860235 RepID=A0A0N9HUB6_9PSEU|nr:hypothetical protein [Kibdelosporangium phytohabitans]ALG06525.1 hypothetical protein AOZ06_05920 [Kibdelosporangium phytohabitans]MBE1467706.1 hypothetical protein [Kibdelosporangium phytohabitans]